MSYEFADRLIELRKSKGMSQEELAQRIGLSRQAVSKWERAESSPDIGNLVALADIYELTIDEIVKGVVRDQGSEDAVIEPSDETTVEDVVIDIEETSEEAMSAEEGDTVATIPPPDPSQRVIVGGPITAEASFVDPADLRSSHDQSSVTNVKIDHMHIDPGVAERVREAHLKRPKDPLLTFPYPLACALLYLILGFVFGWWHPAWIIFFTIPFYYWIVNVIMKDPNYRAEHPYFDEQA